MTDLEDFAGELKRLIGRPSTARPFVCEGSPLTCTAFIVGFNAATELRLDFWTHWRDGLGLDKAAWYRDYLAERAARPLKPAALDGLLSVLPGRELRWWCMQRCRCGA